MWLLCTIHVLSHIWLYYIERILNNSWHISNRHESPGNVMQCCTLYFSPWYTLWWGSTTTLVVAVWWSVLEILWSHMGVANIQLALYLCLAVKYSCYRHVLCYIHVHRQTVYSSISAHLTLYLYMYVCIIRASALRWRSLLVFSALVDSKSSYIYIYFLTTDVCLVNMILYWP